MKKAKAFAPGHISGFFQPIYNKEPHRTGSRGAGINVSLGATATVFIQNARKQSIDVFVEGEKHESPVVTYALRNLLQNETVQVRVELVVDLPFSQGFGMSAASALSASYALASVLHKPLKDAWLAAHIAEIELKTGLGDVAAQISGGFEIRTKPGIPPWGSILTIPGSWNVLVCTIDEAVLTPDILTDTSIQSTIHRLGKTCTDALLTNPTIEYFFELAHEFTKKSGVASEKILTVLEEVSSIGVCNMCMLGNSVYTLQTSKSMSELLSNFGRVHHCVVDQRGIRLIK